MTTGNTNTTGAVIMDTLKAALPIGGGSVLAFLHSSDIVITFATHVIGFAASIVGLVWYIIRLKKDLAPRDKKQSKHNR
jgi:ABC-type phosphate/phosphonate transport system ATPase subunit